MRKILISLAVLLLSGAGSGAEPICLAPDFGQSPSIGYGDANLAPAPIEIAPEAGGGYGVYKFQNGAIAPGAEPICDACGGSPWTALGNEFFIQTSVKVLLVQTSIGGGLLTAQAGNHAGIPFWDEGGTMTPAAFTLVDAALAAATAAGYQPRVCWVSMFLGESEAGLFASDPGVVGAGDVNTAFENVKRMWRAKYGESLLVVVFRTGTVTGSLAGLEPGFARMRALEEAFAENDSRVLIGSRLATECAALYGLAQDIHPEQQCNNRLGPEAARTIVASGKWK